MRCSSPSKPRHPGPGRRPVLRDPFINCIRITHAAVTPRANGNQVVKSRLATLTLRDVVSTFIVKHRNLVLAPGDVTLGVKAMSHAGNPDLLGQGFGNLLLFVRLARKVPKLHYSLPAAARRPLLRRATTASDTLLIEKSPGAVHGHSEKPVAGHSRIVQPASRGRKSRRSWGARHVCNERSPFRTRLEARRCNEIERERDSQLVGRRGRLSWTLTTSLLSATTTPPASGPMRRRLHRTFVRLCECLPRDDIAKPRHYTGM